MKNNIAKLHITCILFNIEQSEQKALPSADNIFKHILLNKNYRILIQISPNYVAMGEIDKKSSFFPSWFRKWLGAKGEMMLTMIYDIIWRHYTSII